jgi:hypothetical protein
MTIPGRHFEGLLQAGGQESGNPWAQAVFTLIGNEVVLTVNQREVARIPEAAITLTEQSNVYLLEGGDQPLYFQPRDATAFGEAVAPPMSTAERIAAASAPADATLVMESSPEPEPVPVPIDEPPPQPWWRQWWVVIVGALLLLLILILAFCNDDPETGTTSTTTTIDPVATTSVVGTTSATTVPATTTIAPATTTTAALTTTIAPATTPTTAAPTTTSTPPPEPAFGAGIHIVGEDVDPGIYETGIVTDLSGCGWGRLAGLSGEPEDLIASGEVANHDVVEIMVDDAAFDTDCDAWFPLTELDPLMTTIPEGKWVLGTHIEPGTYEAPGGNECVWERLSGVSGEPEDIIDTDNPADEAVVEIDPGDFAFNSAGCGEWAPA